MAYTSDLDYDFSVTQILSIVERQPDPQWRLPVLPKAGHRILCTAISGKVIYSFSGREIAAEKNDGLFFSDQLSRGGRSDPREPWHFISATFDLCAHSPQAAAQLEAIPWRTPNLPPAMMDSFRELHRIWTGKSTAYILKCRALLEGLLYDLIRLNSAARSDAAHYEKIERVRQYMQDHCDRNFSVEELAAMANYSPSHFRMLFKSIVGMTATQYLARVRVYQARDYLLSGEMNVSEAAARSGYRDLFYFSRQFKAITGHPPSYYRK